MCVVRARACVRVRVCVRARARVCVRVCARARVLCVQPNSLHAHLATVEKRYVCVCVSVCARVHACA